MLSLSLSVCLPHTHTHTLSLSVCHTRTLSLALLLSINGSLHQEILDFHTYMRPMKEEVTLRLAFMDRVREIILSLWPKAEVWALCWFE